MTDAQYGITAENLLFTLPTALKSDPEMNALATVIANELTRHADDTTRVSLYACIDDLPESLLDILADDFKIDWWDGDYSVEEKRNILRNNWRVHRVLGTKASVETAMSALVPGVKVYEWFEYGGEPFHFRLIVDSADEFIDTAKYQRALKKLQYYKNARSVLEGDRILARTQKTGEFSVFAGAALQRACTCTIQCSVPTLRQHIYLTNEDGLILTNEKGDWLTIGEEEAE